MSKRQFDLEIPPAMTVREFVQSKLLDQGVRQVARAERRLNKRRRRSAAVPAVDRPPQGKLFAP